MGLSEEAREHFRSRLQTALPVERDGRIPMTLRAWAVRGRKPPEARIRDGGRHAALAQVLNEVYGRPVAPIGPVRPA